MMVTMVQAGMAIAVTKTAAMAVMAEADTSRILLEGMGPSVVLGALEDISSPAPGMKRSPILGQQVIISETGIIRKQEMRWMVWALRSGMEDGIITVLSPTPAWVIMWQP